MANRVTASEVKEIIDTSLTDPTIEAFISAANNMVTDNLGDSTVLGDSTLKEIERWLTAHFIASTRERMAAKEGVEGAEITYIGKFSDKLNGTPYGQTAVTLDSTGKLSKLGLKQAFIRAITSFE